MSKKVALVLEGGGLRGAYTAGCISWLIDNNIHIDSAYGISTGAWHMCCFLHKNSALEKDLFQFIIPKYKEEGKSQLVIAFGCTGGQHRSVTLAEYFGKYLANSEHTVITHRDIKHSKE